MERRRAPLPSGGPPDEARLAIQAWNTMGGLDWTALPIVADLLGVTDMETLDVLIAQLAVMRDQHG